MSKHSFLRGIILKIRKIFVLLFIAQLLYIIALKWIDPPATITQLGSFFEGNGLKRDYINLEEVSPNAMLAVISSEDQMFPDHNGFDVKSIEKVIKEGPKKSGRIRGASTISQQVAKNVFLWQGKRASWDFCLDCRQIQFAPHLMNEGSNERKVRSGSYMTQS